MSTKDDAARYVFEVANKEIIELNARIRKIAKLTHCAYAYVNNPQEIETWLDEIIKVSESVEQSVQADKSSESCNCESCSSMLLPHES